MVAQPGRFSRLDASQRQEVGWLLEKADAAIQAWIPTQQIPFRTLPRKWPRFPANFVSTLRLCGFDLEAEQIANEMADVAETLELRERLAARMRVVRRIQQRVTAIREALSRKGPSGKRTKKARRSLRGQALTDKQREVLEMVGECKGNKSEAARRLGIDPSTVRQQHKAAMEKLGEMASGLKDPRRTIDPAKLDMGARQDGRTQRQREKLEEGDDDK